jgi:2-polyprenyl-6-methoxyphenol hydroxylase-like FAD-dependent oxidoreductase
MANRQLTVQCCITGGGPAGMMLGFLLARAGIDVAVLEKHGDFLRDFRGDTIHPSTLDVMDDLGLLEEFLRLPHQELPHIDAQFGATLLPFADFTHLPTRCRFVALMPQWDFLNFLAEKGKRYPSFKLLLRTEAEGLIEENGRVTGVRATTPEGTLEIHAALVVAADGRHSTLRQAAGFTPEEIGAPMDVLWLRLSRRPADPDATLGRFGAGQIFIMLNRGEHWQCAYVIPKGSIEKIRARGLDAFRAEVAAFAPHLADRVHELAAWDDIKLLTVAVDRLPRWYRDGLLCIGDAAHAMSPIGGVGINLAIQDAVAAANLLAEPLITGRLTTEDLHRVQRRRNWPTRVTQGLQLVVQNRVIGPMLAQTGDMPVPTVLRLMARFPVLRRIPARLVGVGVRPEHVRSPG